MLTEREQRLKEAYEKQLAMPKWKFILLYGVLGFGLAVGIVVTLVDSWLSHKPVEAELKTNLPINLVMGMLAGAAYGFFSRSTMTKQLQKFKEKE